MAANQPRPTMTFTGYSFRAVLTVFVPAFLVAVFAPVPVVAADISEQVEDAQETVAETAETLNERFQEARLKNRSFDQKVAWIIMGVLAGIGASFFTQLKPGGWGWVGRLGLGLSGAFVGSIVAQMAQVNFGWTPITIYPEELVFSFLFAMIFLAVIHFGWKLMKDKRSKAKKP